MQASLSSRPYLLRGMYEWLVDNDLTPYILVLTEGLNLPANLPVQDGQLVLNISPAACRNLMMGNFHLSFSARFSGTPLQIDLPISSIAAIYARENSQGMVFGQEPSLEGLVEEPESKPESVESASKPVSKASHLSLIK